MDSELVPKTSRRDARAAGAAGAAGPGAAGREQGRARARERGRDRNRAGNLPRLVAAAVGLVGLLLTVAGALQATVFAPSATVQATLAAPRQPVVSTAVGLLGLEGSRVQVQASATGAQNVFIGIGRAADVDAFLAKVARQEVTGWDGARSLTARRLGAEASLPDPAGADVWVVSQVHRGTAGLTWPDAPGQWRLVAATDGTAAAPALTFTWSGRSVRTAAAPFIAVGTVLLVAGVITLLMLTSRSRLDEQDGPDEPDGQDGQAGDQKNGDQKDGDRKPGGATA